jgi:hypothetical protein
MDGVDFTDPGAAGATSTYLDFNSFEQISVATSGANVESQTPGVQLEFVTKQGSNRWTGTARFLYAESGMQDENNSDLSQPSYDPAGPAIAGNGINEIFEKNFDIGGPLVKDNLWFWFGFSQNDINIALINGQADVTKLRNVSAKLHGQFLGKGTYKGFYTVGDKLKSGRGGGVDRPPNTTWNQSGPSPIYGAAVSYFWTPDLETTFQASTVQGGFQLVARGAPDQQIFQDAAGIYADTTFSTYQTDRPVDQLLAKGNYYFDTGDWDHELKFGFRYKTATVDSFSKYSDFDMIATKYYVGQNPASLPTLCEDDPAACLPYVYLYRELNTSVDTEFKNLWVGDTVLKGPWTFTAGLHLSQQTGEQGATSSPANGLAPDLVQGVNFGGFDPGFDWTNIAPRLGVSYVFDWEKRLLLKANYGQYVDALGSATVSYNIPLTYISSNYLWDDANGDNIVDWDPTTSTGEIVDANGDSVVNCLDNQFALNIDPCNTSSATSQNKIDPDLEAPTVDELIFGAEYELMRDFTIGANVTLRQRDNIIWTPYYDQAQFDAGGGLRTVAGSEIYNCNNTASGTAIDGRPYSEPYCVLSDLNDPRVVNQARWETNMPGFSQDYQGLELTATKRLSNKWMMRAFMSYGEWTNSFDGEALTPGIYGSGASSTSGDPTNFRGGTTDDGGLIAVQSLASGNKRDVFVGSSNWQYNINGVYQLPKNWSVSGNLYGRQGYGLADFVAQGGTGEGTKNLQVDSIDTNRYDDLMLLDLRAAKLFTLERNTNVEIAAEVFNVTNDNTELQLGSRLNTFYDCSTGVNGCSSYRRVGEILSPRVLRLVATINF